MRVAKSTAVHTTKLEDVINGITSVKNPAIMKPAERSSFSPKRESASFHAGNSKSANGKSIIENIIPISPHENPICSCR